MNDFLFRFDAISSFVIRWFGMELKYLREDGYFCLVDHTSCQRRNIVLFPKATFSPGVMVAVLPLRTWKVLVFVHT